jgi:hypothetical protein
MSRAQKIAAIGTRGFDVRDDEKIVACFEWARLDRLVNLRDYDVVIINLWNGKPVDADWDRFRNLLNLTSMREILMPGGRVYILGDPRFQIDVKSGENEEAVPFLFWTGMTFYWDEHAGDTINRRSGYTYKQYEPLLDSLTRWSYSLRRVEVDLDSVWQTFNKEFFNKEGYELAVELDELASNRYGGALAARVHMVIRVSRTRYSTSTEPVAELGPITWLPATSLKEEDAVALVLRDLCGVEAEAPEPTWLSSYTAPGQKKVDDEIAKLRAEIESAIAEWQSLNGLRDEARECLRLLYERGQPLEKAVRNIIRQLGAKVEDPEDLGKEDGWLSVQVDDQLYEGVLEVKSTRAGQFGEDGLRQLLDWVGRGVSMRQKKYRGIFVGSNAVDKPVAERPWAFSDSWTKSAQLHEFTAIKTEDLYLAFVLHHAGRLDSKDFWRLVFQTDGVLDVAAIQELAAAE